MFALCPACRRATWYMNGNCGRCGRRMPLRVRVKARIAANRAAWRERIRWE